MAPYLWTLPFTHLSPQSCFVLDDGEGNAVGYVIGCPDVFALAADSEHCWPRYVAEVLGSPQGRADVPAPAQLRTREPWTTKTTTTKKKKKDEHGGDGEGVEEVEEVVEVSPNPACLAQLAYKAEWLVLDGGVEGKGELIRGWRAMMHIDLLDEWQGKGWGRKLIERFVEGVRNSGQDYGRGIQIGVAGDNTKVLPFYQKCGFRVYPGGEREGNVWMVRDL